MSSSLARSGSAKDYGASSPQKASADIPMLFHLFVEGLNHAKVGSAYRVEFQRGNKVAYTFDTVIADDSELPLTLVSKFPCTLQRRSGRFKQKLFKIVVNDPSSGRLYLQSAVDLAEFMEGQRFPMKRFGAEGRDRLQLRFALSGMPTNPSDAAAPPSAAVEEDEEPEEQRPMTASQHRDMVRASQAVTAAPPPQQEQQQQEEAAAPDTRVSVAQPVGTADDTARYDRAATTLFLAQPMESTVEAAPAEAAKPAAVATAEAPTAAASADPKTQQQPPPTAAEQQQQQQQQAAAPPPSSSSSTQQPATAVTATAAPLSPNGLGSSGTSRGAAALPPPMQTPGAARRAAQQAR